MIKRIFAGLIIGVSLQFVLGAAATSYAMHYLSIVISSFVAALISGSVMLGGMVAIITGVSQIVILHFAFSSPIQNDAITRNYYTLATDFIFQVIIGFIGAWVGARLHRYVRKSLGNLKDN